MEDFIGAIPVGAGAAVVLGDEPLATTWRPVPGVPGGVIVRWRYAPSREHARRRIEALPRLDLPAGRYRVGVRE